MFSSTNTSFYPALAYPSLSVEFSEETSSLRAKASLTEILERHRGYYTDPLSYYLLKWGELRQKDEEISNESLLELKKLLVNSFDGTFLKDPLIDSQGITWERQTFEQLSHLHFLTLPSKPHEFAQEMLSWIHSFWMHSFWMHSLTEAKDISSLEVPRMHMIALSALDNMWISTLIKKAQERHRLQQETLFMEELTHQFLRYTEETNQRVALEEIRVAEEKRLFEQCISQKCSQIKNTFMEADSLNKQLQENLQGTQEASTILLEEEIKKSEKILTAIQNIEEKIKSNQLNFFT